MTTRTPKCRAQGGAAHCTNPNCPEKRAARDAFYRNMLSTPNQWVADAAASDSEQLANLKKVRKSNNKRIRSAHISAISVDSQPEIEKIDHERTATRLSPVTAPECHWLTQCKNKATWQVRYVSEWELEGNSETLDVCEYHKYAAFS